MTALDQDYFEMLPVAALVLDRSGRIARCNQRARMLFDASLVGQLWRDTIPQLFSDTASGVRGDCLADGRRVEIEVAALPQGGQIVSFALANNAPENISVSNVTQLMARLVHQIRTPLSAAMLKLSQHKDYDALSNSVLQSLKRINVMVDDFLSFAGRVPTATDDIALDVLIKSLCEDLQPVALEYGCELKLARHDAVRVVAHQSVLLGALENIVINAFQACSGKGLVVVDMYREAHNVLLTIADNGQGIDESEIQWLCDPYYTTRISGTGIGLAIAESVIRSYNGSLAFSSKKGCGTTVTIQLPIHIDSYANNQEEVAA